MEMIAWILPGLYYCWLFGIDMIMSLQSVIFFFCIVGLTSVWVGKPAVLFLCGGNPTKGACKFLASEWGKPNNGVVILGL